MVGWHHQLDGHVDGPPATGSAEKSFSMKMFGEHVRAKTNLFLWHFEGKNQKMRVRRGRLFE